jgi:hypothetical protein
VRVTVTGSLSILAASLRADGSLIFSTSLGRKGGNPASAHETPKRPGALRFLGNGGCAGLAVRASIFLSPAG